MAVSLAPASSTRLSAPTSVPGSDQHGPPSKAAARQHLKLGSSAWGPVCCERRSGSETRVLMQVNGEATRARAIKSSAPLFYKSPMLLRPGPNVRSGLTGRKGYEFARGAVAVPIGVSEFPLAARHYPISPRSSCSA
jgi:hypothetical protein